MIVGGNNSQIELMLENNDYGFLLNATNRSVIVGKRLQILWPEATNQITASLKVRCSPISSTSSKEVCVLQSNVSLCGSLLL